MCACVEALEKRHRQRGGWGEREKEIEWVYRDAIKRVYNKFQFMR